MVNSASNVVSSVMDSVASASHGHGGLLIVSIALYGVIMGHLIRRILQLMPASVFLNATRSVEYAAPTSRSAGYPSLALHRTGPGSYPCEISCVLVFTAMLIIGGPTMCLPGGLLFGWFLLTLGWIDHLTLLLPDRLTGPLLVCGLGSHITAGDGGSAFHDGLLGAIGGGTLLWLVQRLFQWIKGYEGMGGGDIKLLAALGAWLGWQVLPGLCCCAALSGLAGYAICGRMQRKIPFGPCLALAGWVIYISP